MIRLHLSRRDSSGATLLLALGFMLAGSLLVMALLSWTGNGLLEASQAANSLNLRYDVNAAVQMRIQDLRYRYQPSQSFAACPGWPITNLIGPPTSTSSRTSSAAVPDPTTSNNITVYCSISTDETSANSRTVTFDACLSTAPDCTSNPYLSAVVTYNDFDSSGNGNCSPSSITTCGQNMTVVNWDEPR